MNSQQHVLIFLGPQGSGKGTQLELLQAIVGWPVIVMGDVFRAEATKATPRGQAVKALIDGGEIVPPKLWEPVLRDYLATFQHSGSILLDGVVRSPEQVSAFDRIRAELNLPEPLIINLQVPREESMTRLLKRHRHDDTREAIERRLQWSAEQTKPVIDHYRQSDRVIDINGNQSVDAVHQEIVHKLTDAGILSNA